MAAIYSNGVTAGIFLVSILLKEMRYLVYIIYLCESHIRISLRSIDTSSDSE
jgi:hypothetical protein